MAINLSASSDDAAAKRASDAIVRQRGIQAQLAIQSGDMVRCLHGSIDHKGGKGAIGRVTGFARFSAYHSREAFVTFDDQPENNGWFWVSDLEAA